MLERMSPSGGAAGFSAPGGSGPSSIVSPYTPVGTQPAIITPRVCDVFTFSTDGVNVDTLNFPEVSGEAIDLISGPPLSPWPFYDDPGIGVVQIPPQDVFFEVELNIPQAVRSQWVSAVASLRGWLRQDVYPVPLGQRYRVVETFRGLRVNSFAIPNLSQANTGQALAFCQLVIWHVRPDSVGNLAV